MTDAHVPGTPFNFDNVVLHTPISASQKGGGYFSRISGKDSRPLLVQTTTMRSKAGLTKGTRVGHLDVLVDPDGNLCGWLADLEATIVDNIAKNASTWFTSAMGRDEVDYLLVPTCKTLRKKTAMRTIVPIPRYAGQDNSVTFFDENEHTVPRETLTPESEFIAVIEVSGVRFTTSSMRIELTTRQVMIIGERTPATCLIKKPCGENVAAVEVAHSSNSDTTEPTVVLEITNATSETASAGTNNGAEQEQTAVESFVDDDSDAAKQSGLGGATNDSTDTRENRDGSESQGAGNHSTNIEDGTCATGLEEVIVGMPNDGPVIGLKEKNEVYRALYEEVYQKARESKKQAIRLYLEAQELQSEHALTAIESSEDEDEGEHFLH
jgi:hypothetical protein